MKPPIAPFDYKIDSLNLFLSFYPKIIHITIYIHVEEGTYSRKRIERGSRRFFHSNVLICQDNNIEMVSLRFYTICIGLDQGVISGWNTHIHTHTHTFPHRLIFTHNLTQRLIFTHTFSHADTHIFTHRLQLTKIATLKKHTDSFTYKYNKLTKNK